MKLYTKTGDHGTTSAKGKRLEKHNVFIDVLGSLDELNSLIGFARTELSTDHFKSLRDELLTIQHEIFDFGTELASSDNQIVKNITLESIHRLEQSIDAWVDQTPPLERFILPGGSKASAALHLCRTATRHTERKLSMLQVESNACSKECQAYINRLSDYFFAIARVANFLQDIKDVEYIQGSPPNHS